MRACGDGSPLKNSLPLATFWRLVSNGCAVLAAFVSLRLYNLHLSREVYGVLLVAVQVLGYLPVIGGGFGMVVNQQLLGANEPSARMATARFRQLLLSYFVLFSLIVGSLIMLAYGRMPVARTLPTGLFLCIGLSGAITILAGGELVLLVGLGRQSASFLGQALWSLVMTGLLYLGFRVGLGAWSLPLSTIGGALFVLVLAKSLIRRDHPGLPIISWRQDPDFGTRLRAIWRPSLHWQQSQFLTVMLFTSDLLLVGLVVGPAAAAVYGVFSRVMAMSRQTLGSLCEAAWPRFTQEKDPARKTDLMRKVDRLNAWLTGCWFGTMGATLLPFLHALVQANWVAGPWLAGLLLVRNFLICLASPHSYGLLSLARFRELAGLGQREVILSVAAAGLLGWRWGMEGIALGYLLATIAVTGWQTTRTYFVAMGAPWRREWIMIYGYGLSAAVLALLAAWFGWLVLGGLKLPLAGTAFFIGAVTFGLLGGLPIGNELRRRLLRAKA